MSYKQSFSVFGHRQGIGSTADICSMGVEQAPAIVSITSSVMTSITEILSLCH
ncbi:MAG: hypothetical protein IPG82_19695 [Saprospiraceae bacterium]|nr:hypothetical protein [Saprospiraceae bacterium]